MRIGVIGSGDVGRTLAAGLAAEGHETMVGTRDPARPELAEWSAKTRVPLASFAETASAAEIVILATAWGGTGNALDLAGEGNLSNKPLIDATNPLKFTDRLELALGFSDSGAEQVQRWAPGARVVKAFNTVGWDLMIHPDVAGGRPTMFIAGDDGDAKTLAGGLAGQLGWAVHDAGPLMASRYLEPMAMVWIEHAMRSGRRDHAFALVQAAKS
jgi:hypothetical protein